MNYPAHDTDWATSAKGNIWKRTNGILFVVGENKYGAYWAMRDGIYLNEMFDTAEAAMYAAENDYDSDDASSGNEQREWW